MESGAILIVFWDSSCLTWKYPLKAKFVLSGFYKFFEFSSYYPLHVNGLTCEVNPRFSKLFMASLILCDLHFIFSAYAENLVTLDDSSIATGTQYGITFLPFFLFCDSFDVEGMFRFEGNIILRNS